MSVSQYAYLVAGWALILLIMGIVDGAITGQSDLQVVLSMQVIEFKEFIKVPLPVPNLAWVSSAYNLATWNFWVFANDIGQWVRWVVALSLMGALSWGFVTNILPIVISGVSALTGTINALKPT